MLQPLKPRESGSTYLSRYCSAIQLECASEDIFGMAIKDTAFNCCSMQCVKEEESGECHWLPKWLMASSCDRGREGIKIELWGDKKDIPSSMK